MCTVARFIEQIYAPMLRQSGLRTAEGEVRRVTKGPARRFFGSMLLSHVTEWQVQRFVKARRDDGAIRATASEFLPGTPMGGFSPSGRRTDDPNDRIAHQHRRSLRSCAAR